MALVVQDARATLPYGGITRIRFRGTFSPRLTPRGPLTCMLKLMEMWDNCNTYKAFTEILRFGYFSFVFNALRSLL